MKQLIAFAFVALMGFNAMAQPADLRRKISVSGNAELEVTPDIIYVSISLKEYLKDNNSKKKVDITALETQLYNVVAAAGIPKENLTISNLSSWNYATEKRKNPDFLASKQYRLKVNDLYKYNAILDGIDPKGIQNTYIEGYDYSKIADLKKDLKIKALLAAKEKAEYMVAALNNSLGDVLDIQEVNNESYPQPVYRTFAMAKSASVADEVAAPEIDAKKIKLNYIVNAVFEITAKK